MPKRIDVGANVIDHGDEVGLKRHGVSGHTEIERL
jgi:hypothetical protein